MLSCDMLSIQGDGDWRLTFMLSAGIFTLSQLSKKSKWGDGLFVFRLRSSEERPESWIMSFALQVP